MGSLEILRHEVASSGYEAPSEYANHEASQSSTIFAVATSINDRARRNKLLPTSLFSDPAWDMLLALYSSELRQHRVSVSSLCTASQVPATTALRWISALSEHGLIARDADPFDGRRFFVRLTETGSAAMALYFSKPRAAEGAGRSS